MRRTISQLWGSYSPTGQFWLSLAVVALIVDAAICYRYGSSLSWWHGAGFALVAVFFTLAPDAAYSEIEAKRYASGVAVGALCIPLGWVALYSHLGYGAGVRSSDILQASVQTRQADLAFDNVADHKTNLALWRKQLADLQAQNAWAATVTADGLRAQLASAQKAIDLEAARGGCKAACLKLMQDKGRLEEKIAAVERVTDLTGRIESTQRLVEKAITQAAATPPATSTAATQTSVGAKLFLAFTGATPEQSINPDKVTMEFTNIFVTGAGSLAFMIMAPLGMFLAGRHRKPTPHQPAPAQIAQPVVMAPSPLDTFSAAYRRHCEARGANPIGIAA